MKGISTSFTVEATGDNLQFQWQKDGQDIDRNVSRLQCSNTANTSTLHINVVEKSDEGHYKCHVKNLVEKSGKASHVAKLNICKLSFYSGIMVVCTVLTISLCLWN